jgi:outer membrane lipoprotein-sorting protein
MNCNECRENLVAHIEGLLEAQQEREVAAHLRSCPACRAEAEEHARLRNSLIAGGEAFSQKSVAQSVMDRILREQTLQIRKFTMRKRYGRAGLGLTAAAAIVGAVLIGWPGSQDGRAYAAEVFAQAVQALSNLHAVHLKANMRTLPGDNFEMIDLRDDFVPIEMWKRFDTPPQWRIAKPGRVVVMDGESSLLFIEPNLAAKGGIDTGFVSWLKPLLDVDQVLDSELRRARLEGEDLLLTHEQGDDGAPKLVVTIEAKADGDYANDWLRNKTISDSDHRRVYRFDARTKLLEGLQVFVHAEEEDVLVFEITEIEYDPELDPSLFALDLPEDVIWFEEPAVLPDNERYAAMSPQEAAYTFFQACAEKDWDEVLKFSPTSTLDDRMKEYLGGLELISLGKPFKSGRYPGWFVPYEIKLKFDGSTKSYKLAVRNDNPAGRYIVDGGI